MDELYNRQQTLPLKNLKSVAVIGCGGTGSWVAQGIALSGVPEIALFDPDMFEETNFNRIPLPLTCIGQNKAEATRDHLKTLRPDTNFVVFGRADSFSLSQVSPDVLFDCTDDSEFQEWLESYCKEKKITYIRSGYNGGNHISAVGQLSKFKTKLPRVRRYEIQPSWACPAALAGMLAVYKAMLNPDFGFVGNISELGVKVK